MFIVVAQWLKVHHRMHETKNQPISGIVDDDVDHHVVCIHSDLVRINPVRVWSVVAQLPANPRKPGIADAGRRRSARMETCPD